MARSFTRGDKITLGIGTLNITPPFTMAAIWKRNETAVSSEVFRAGAATGRIICAVRSTGDIMRLFNDTTNADAATLAVANADGWVCAAWSKAAGTVAPRFHLYKYSTNVWAHENSAATLADNTAPATNGFIGSSPGAFAGDIAVEGIWNVVLTDAEIERLAFSLTNWFATQVQPKGIWVLDQQATGQKVNDLTGNGAKESAISGTSATTSSVPVFSYGSPAPRVQIQPAAAGGGGAAGPRDLILLGAG